MEEKILSEDKKIVLVGMTGTVDSTVAAYLLSKQEYKCVGLCILFEKFDAATFKDNESMYGNCLAQNLDKVKKICAELDMPFYAVNAQEQYKERILDFEVSGRLEGKTFSHCVECHRLILDILLEKADLLAIHSVATGHYSKVKFNRHSEEFSLHSSTDLGDDQSYLLSSIKQEHLQRLMLPLGDLRKKEVIKLGKTLKYNFHSFAHKTYCFFNNEKIIEYIEQNAAPALQLKGDIATSSEKEVLGEHSGIHQYYVGQSKFTGQDESLLGHYKVCDIDTHSKRITVAHPNEIVFDFCFLVDFKTVNSVDLTRPFRAYAQWSTHVVRASCLVLLKVSDMVTLLFDKKEQGPLPVGAMVALYNRNTPTAKLIGVGRTLKSGSYELLLRMQGMLTEDVRVAYEEDRLYRNIDEAHY